MDCLGHVTDLPIHTPTGLYSPKFKVVQATPRYSSTTDGLVGTTLTTVRTCYSLAYARGLAGRLTGAMELAGDEDRYHVYTMADRWCQTDLRSAPGAIQCTQGLEDSVPF